jgi:hypothetical protein
MFEKHGHVCSPDAVSSQFEVSGEEGVDCF